MLALTLALTLLAQDPGSDTGWALAGSGSGEVAAAVRVEGDVELSRGEAEEAALREARDLHRGRLRERGEQLADRLAPFWLPTFLVRDEIDGWLRREERSAPLRVLESETAVKSYTYGEAFRTTLQVAALPDLGRDAESRLERRLQRVGKLLLAKLGGIAVFWGLLAFAYSWIDRLTRGYMPWRLRFIAAGLGLAVPTALLLA